MIWLIVAVLRLALRWLALDCRGDGACGPGGWSRAWISMSS